eukprot:GILJ01007544.1.p1 GENE.GILJ01007544.1~~GILJ01007544.1.p1  ORF type:complete len:2402 (-),score=355.14 GILJ01007544.1:281-6541(-)
MALAVGDHITPYIDSIIALIKDGLTPRSRRPFCHEALTCVSMLPRAVGPALVPHMQDLVDQMFSAGLSSTLINALRELSQHIPSLLPAIQEKLLSAISVILTQKPYAGSAAMMDNRRSSSNLTASFMAQKFDLVSSAQASATDVTDASLIVLALNTLGSFEFRNHQLIQFVKDIVITFLDDENASIRKEAAITCSSLLMRPGEVVPKRGYTANVIGEILERLLTVAIADPDPAIRRTVLASLDDRFDHYLAQAENLRSLFIALNDEIFEVRETAITIIGRLSAHNPAYVMPSLRKTLIQLLTELEFSGDSRNKEESAHLLGHMIQASHRLIYPYVDPIVKALLPKLKDSNPNVSGWVLSAVGELALVGGKLMIPYLDELFPLFIDALQDQSSMVKREIALRTLGQTVESTGYVIRPYLKYPNLLDIVFNALKGEQSWTLRREVIRVLGIIGALDPYRHKINQMHLRGQVVAGPEDGGETPMTRDDALTTPASANDVLPGMVPSSEDYYPTVAITALMRILRDPSLSAHHNMVIQAVMFIFKSLGLKCVPFLPQIIPPFLQVMRNCEDGLRESLFQQLGVLVSIVKQHIRNYLDPLFKLIQDYWKSPALLIQILSLLEEISAALKDEFKVYLPDLIPQLLNILHTDRSERRQLTLKVLHALVMFGSSVDDYLYLVIPALVKLCEQDDATLSIRQATIQTLGRLCRTLNFSDYASRIIHPLVRILDGPYPQLKLDAMETLCSLVRQLGSDYAIFVPMVNKVLTRHRIQHPIYESLVSKLLKHQELPLDLLNDRDGSHVDSPSAEESINVEIGTVKKLHVNQQNLKKAWEASQRSTKDDWAEWMRRFSVELLRESPSPALRSCSALAQVYHPLARELFNAAFVSCWSELYDQYQDYLVRSLETAFQSPNIPAEILQTLLNLAEFMEHDDKALPIDIRTLGALAEKCHAYAKALHYKELEFHTSPGTTIEALISINNQLQQPEAAVGILNHARRHLNFELKESWYEKLHRWEDALEAYERKQLEDPLLMELTLGRMRCLHALGEYERLAMLSQDLWRRAEEASMRRDVAPLAAAAAWNLGQWDLMEDYVSAMEEDRVDGSFFRSVLAIYKDDYEVCQTYINRCRELLDTELTALVGESYNRAYRVVVQVQQLAELEEIIEYKQNDTGDKQARIRALWAERLRGCQRNVEVWSRVLNVRSLVIPPHNDLDTWVKFASLCRKSGRLSLSLKILTTLMNPDTGSPSIFAMNALPEANSASILAGTSSSFAMSFVDANNQSAQVAHYRPRVIFAYLKHLHAAGSQQEAMGKLRGLVQSVKEDLPLLSRCCLKLGQWQRELSDTLDEANIQQVLSSFRAATEADPQYYKAWHAWALMNFEAVSFYEKAEKVDKQSASAEAIGTYLVPAVRGFFRSIALGRSRALQDILRLLTLWFKHGSRKDVEAALADGFSSVSIDTWLTVIPQIIARIHAPNLTIRKLIHDLLARIGRDHPQALIYPLTVASKSQSASRKAAAVQLMEKMRYHSAVLVDQALLVSQELIRVAILWHEMWHEGLEEASRLYFGDRNVEGMLQTLAPLHQMMEQGPETLREVSFQQAFGRELQEALEWCKKFKRTGRESDLNQAWDLYYHVFRRINKQLPQLTTLELQYVSPKLLAATDLELAVPGTYRAGEAVVNIRSFAPSLNVISSKQRPRKLTIHGSDGKEYVFLLKGHEDLRQDERVMQLFGLVNTLLAHDPETSKKDLSIRRYAVIPLSPNSGLIGWVPHCDTLHQLIRDYRESRKILLNIEHRLMLQMAPDYDNLTLIEKVEVFEYALENTTGQDLYKVLWLKSQNSEVWLDRRTNYTRSLAVMSMVGYILGLGDRHPSNLMLDRYSGKILHIDFGDCFEVAMHREKYPEKIPFRLTRMLINAMEVSKLEGNFKSTCENVMRVLRENKDSVMAMLEAFVHDPLINWRLLTTNSPRNAPTGATNPPGTTRETGESTKTKAAKLAHQDFSDVLDAETSLSGTLQSPSRKQRGDRERELLQALGPEGSAAPSEVLNERAMSVMRRISNKLTGRDFANNEVLDVHAQVERLIGQATAHEHLCQCYIGWCPFW